MLRIAIVGSGPSAMFAAAELLKRGEVVALDVLDRLPTPFGLVRYGVAPDHHKIKAVCRTLSKTFADPRARFLGNVTVGSDVSVAELRAAYDGVLVATGAPRARGLDIPGEDLPGNYAAADLVSWYNAHPYAGVPYSTSADSIAVIGAGNVSLDIARVLLKAGAGLGDTDVTDPVRDALNRHPVREVHVIARRSASEVRFSHPELLEFDRLDGVDPIVDPADLPGCEVPVERATANRLEVFRRWATQRRDPTAKRLRFHFLRSPVRILGDGHVTGLRLRHNTADPAPAPSPASITTTLPVQAVVRSIGYHGEPLAGVPFDHERGLIPNDAGRVEPGLYVTGWIKRGPSGVIGSNKACAIETVATMLDDLDLVGSPPAVRDRLVARLTGHPDRRRRAVSWAGWTGIDAAEIALGALNGRARTKIADPDRLLDIATRAG